MNKKLMSNKLALAINISTSSVDGLLMVSGREEAPEIIKVLRVEMPLVPDRDFQSLWRNTRSSLDKLISEIHKFASHKINLAAVTFSSPWHISQTRVARFKREGDFKVSKNLADTIIEDEIDRFQNEIKSSFLKPGEEMMIVEKEVMKSLLNGYEVEDYHGKKAKEFELYIHLSGIKRAIHDEISSIIHRRLGRRVDVVFNCLPFVSFDTLRHIFDVHQGFLMVDIGGELTDISLIRNGFLEQTVSFMEGWHSMVRKMAGITKVPLEPAFSLLKRHIEGELSKEGHNEASGHISELAKNWYNFFEAVLKNFSKVSPLPQTVFLVGELAGLQEIQQIVSGEQTAKFTFLRKPFTVQKFLPASLEERFHFKEGIKDRYYTSLIISSLFTDNYVWQKR